MSFLFFCCALIILALLFVIGAIIQRSAENFSGIDSHHQRIVRNVRIYQQRMQELDNELQEEYITQDVYDKLYSELTRQLLATVEQLEAAPADSQARKKWLPVLLLVPFTAILIYQAIGAYPDWLIAQQLTSMSKSESMEEYRANLDGLYKSLEDRLQQRPEQIDYRLLLARYAMGQQNYEDAAQHYRILAEILPDNADALAYYAQAEYMRVDKKVTSTVAEYMDKALRIDPYNTTALGMQGMYAFESGDLPAAIRAWENLLKVINPEDERALLIQAGIKQAQKQLEGM